MQKKHSLQSIQEVDEVRNRFNSLFEDKNDSMMTLNELSKKTSEMRNHASQECSCPGSNHVAIRLITGASCVGKVPNSCEDAYFITERGFGVADGVSGWNDYGFSSSAFSSQLMQYS